MADRVDVMRKTILATALGLTAGLAAPTGQQDTDVAAQLEATRTELTAVQARLDQVESYLQAQAKSAEALATALTSSEEAGFTAGINPKSREILLDAWHAQATAATTSVPGAKTDDKKKR
jgi:hypothetical protein